MSDDSQRFDLSHIEPSAYAFRVRSWRKRLRAVLGMVVELPAADVRKVRVVPITVGGGSAGLGSDDRTGAGAYATPPVLQWAPPAREVESVHVSMFGSGSRSRREEGTE